MKIAKKYLSSASGLSSYHQVRKWVHKGATVKEIAEALTASYGEAKDKDKLHISTMLALAYDFASPKLAEKCLGLTGAARKSRMSVGQTVFLRRCEQLDYVDWVKVYSDSVRKWKPLVEKFDTDQWHDIIYEEHSGRVLTVDREDHIHALRSNDGSLTLFILNDCNSDMLIDESSFISDAPLYFTESTHFVSPVYKINLVGKILDYCFAMVGYPPVNIKREVIFTSSSAKLMNIDEYTGLGSRVRDWDGVTVGFSAKSASPYFYDCIHFLDEFKVNSFRNNVLNMMIDSLAAASMLYKRIKIDFGEEFVNADDKLLKRLAKEEEIFC